MDSVEGLLSTNSLASEFRMATTFLAVVIARTVVTVNGEASQQEFGVVDLFVQPSFSSVDNVGVIDSYRCAEGGDFIFDALEIGY